MSVPSPALGLGDRIGRFEILATAGRGSQGTVYRARDLELEREVALKVLPAARIERARVARFEREARLVASLNDPRIATLFELCHGHGLHVLVMEWVAGETLAERLQRGALEVDEALPLFVQLAEALEHAHRSGVIHRDLKPANIKITPNQEVKVLDFGVARALGDNDHRQRAGDGTQSRAPPRGSRRLGGLGTPAYMSPEQARGLPVDARADIWAFGCLLFEALSGRRAFAGSSPEQVLTAVLRASPEWQALPEEAPEIRRLVCRCLEKEPRDRLQDIGDARVELEALLRASWSRRDEGSADSAAGPSGFQAILCTQLVAVAELRQRLGVGPVTALTGRHDELFRSCLREYDGRELEHLGDGFVAAFARPSDAVRCALAFDSQLAELELEERARVRMGVYAGELDPEGAVIDAAARLLGLAGPDQILMTEVVFDAARREIVSAGETPGLEWLAHGAYRFSGREAPLQIFEAGIRGRAALQPPRDTELARRALAPGEAETLGWRPARGLAIPGRAHWRVEERIGEGGFGEVWLAVHEKTRDRRVFKFCFDPERVRGLQREVVLFRLLRDALGEREDIAQILDWQFDRPPFFLEAEHTAGGSLPQWCARRGGVAAVPLVQRLELVAQIAEALAAAHGVGILHKDVKPSNILVSEPAGPTGPKACLTDFGIGLVTDRKALAGRDVTVAGFTRTLLASSSSAGAGTALYLAPEVVEGKAPTVQSDLYSLGVVLYQLVIGDLERALAPGWERDVADELLREDIAACVDGAPQRRLASAAALAQRLRSLEARRDARRAEERADLEAQRARRRRRLLAGVAVAALVASLIAGGLALEEQRRRSRAERQQYDTAIELAATHVARNDLAKARGVLERAPERLRGPEWGLLVDRAWPAQLEPRRPARPAPGRSVADLWRGAGVVVVAELEHGSWAEAHWSTEDRLLHSDGGPVTKLWDVASGEVVFTARAPAAVGTSTLSHDGRLLAVGLANGTVQLWDLETGELRQTLAGHAPRFVQPWFSPDDSLVVTSAQGDRTLGVWETATGQLLRTFPETTEVWNVIDLVFLDDTRVLVPSRNHTLRIWNLLTGTVERVVHGPAWPRAVPAALSPDGRVVLSFSTTPSWLESPFLWSRESGQVLYALPFGSRLVWWPGFSADGSCLAALYEGGTVRVLEVATGDVLMTAVGAAAGAHRLRISPDGSLLALAHPDGKIQVLAPTHDPPRGRDRLAGHEALVLQVVWSPDGSRLATVSYDGTVGVWDRASRRRLVTLPHPRKPAVAEFSPDGTALWTWTYTHHRLWDADSGELRLELASGVAAPPLLEDIFIVNRTEQWSRRHFSPDGRRLVLAFAEGARVVDTRSGETVLALDTDAPTPRIELGPRGERIVTAGERSARATVWDAHSGRRLWELEAETALGNVVFSPDGSAIAGTANDGAITLWDAALGTVLWRVAGHPLGAYTVRFDATGRRLASAAIDGSAKIWDTATGVLLATLAEHPDQVRVAYFSPDGALVLTKSDIARVWDPSGRQLVALGATDTTGSMLQARWSPDGRTIAAPLTDGTVRLFEAIPWTELQALGDGAMPLGERVRLWRGAPTPADRR